jgi:hypothetical protein
MYVLYSETASKNRCNGARGGRVFARNQRLRKLLAPPPPPQAPHEDEPPETAHEAGLLLDRQFPWLAGAFAPRPRRKPAVCDPYQPLDR